MFDHVQEWIDAAVANGATANVRPDAVCRMHAIGMQDLIPSAGVYRDGPVAIENSKHTPPAFGDVPGLVDEMCATLARASDRTPLWLASYALWRLNWIHPFADGNGRTARALCHVVLSIHLKLPRMPPGPTLPERILREKLKYWRCLQEADSAYRRRRTVSVSHMEGFLGRLLRAMLADDTGR